MTHVTITKSVEAYQWNGGTKPEDHFDGMFLCRPEVHMSASGDLVYFTYGNLRPRDWMSVAKLPAFDPENPPKEALKGYVRYDPKEGQGEPYAREVLCFTFWSVKTKSSIDRDWKPVFLDTADEAQVALWHDYCSLEQWPNPIPRMAEFRETDGKYGRGYRPWYLGANDWLLKDRDADGKTIYSVVTDEQFKAMRP